MVGGVAATAAVRTFPFRVFSFPSQPIIPKILVCPPGVPQRFTSLDRWDMLMGWSGLVFRPNSAELLVRIDWDCDFETGIVTVSP